VDPITPIEDPDPIIEDPVVTAERSDLRALLGEDTLDVVGVTVDPLTGQQFLFDSGLGLYALDNDDSAFLLLPLADMPVPDVPARSGFTDIAALGADRFALPALDNGYLLDLGAATLSQYFCYLPPALPDRENVEQLTLSVAFDSRTERLFAQPETLDKETGELLGSSVGEFSRETGEDLLWYNLPEFEFLAGGMAVEDSGLILLGRGSELYRFDRATWELSLVADLAEWGVDDIAGMALDQAGTLLVIDAADQELVRLSASLLE
jgi:hypothetical protein